MKNILNTLKQLNWVEYSIQFFLVLISIIIAFNVENYRDYKQERRVEQEYLSSMVDELKVDLEYFNGEVSIFNRHLDAYDYFLENKPDTLSNKDSLANILFLWHMDLRNFSPMDITYTSMKTSGKLELIENKEIRKQMIMLEMPIKVITPGQFKLTTFAGAN